LPYLAIRHSPFDKAVGSMEKVLISPSKLKHFVVTCGLCGFLWLAFVACYIKRIKRFYFVEIWIRQRGEFDLFQADTPFITERR